MLWNIRILALVIIIWHQLNQLISSIFINYFKLQNISYKIFSIISLMTIIDKIEMRNFKIVLNFGNLDDKHKIVPQNIFETLNLFKWKVKSETNWVKTDAKNQFLKINIIYCDFFFQFFNLHIHTILWIDYRRKLSSY